MLAVAKAGVPGYDADAWFGLFVPAATPRDIPLRLNTDVLNGLQAADLR